MLKWLRGVGIPPFVTGTARACLEAGVFAVVPVILDALSGPDVPAWLRAMVPLFVLGWGMAVATIDQIDPAKRRAP